MAAMVMGVVVQAMGLVALGVLGCVAWSTVFERRDW
jgi:hypothetical protein